MLLCAVVTMTLKSNHLNILNHERLQNESRLKFHFESLIGDDGNNNCHLGGLEGQKLLSDIWEKLRVLNATSCPLITMTSLG